MIPTRHECQHMEKGACKNCKDPMGVQSAQVIDPEEKAEETPNARQARLAKAVRLGRRVLTR